MTPATIASRLKAKYGLLGAHRLIRTRAYLADLAGDAHRLFRWVGIGLALHDTANWD